MSVVTGAAFLCLLTPGLLCLFAPLVSMSPGAGALRASLWVGFVRAALSSSASGLSSLSFSFPKLSSARFLVPTLGCSLSQFSDSRKLSPSQGTGQREDTSVLCEPSFGRYVEHGGAYLYPTPPALGRQR